MNATKFETWEDAVSWLIAQPEQQEIIEACYYDTPLQSAADRYWHSTEWQAIRSFFPPAQGTALDIGAGNGIASYALAKDGWQVAALEPDDSNLVGVGAIRQLARDCNLSIDVVQEFGEQLPFPDAHFNVILARQVLHHARDLPQLCREIDRVLKPGGVFIAARDHVISTKADLPKFLDAHPLHKLYGGEHAYLRSEYIEAIESANLKIKRVLDPFDSPINYCPYTSEMLKQKLSTQLSSLPAAGIFSSFLLSNAIFPYTLKLLSKLDRRPGRVVSFICYKR
jgi:SAM-dependent methyltransferase